MPITTRFASAVSTVGTWSNATNIYSDDGVYATTAGSRNTNWDIIGSSFGFTIPAGSTINSVTCEIEYKLSTTASAHTNTLQMQYNGSLKGTAVTSTAEPTTDTKWTKSTNNGTWTVTELNNNLTQVLWRVRRTSNTACTYSIDYMTVTVDYTEPTYDFSGSVTSSSSSNVTLTNNKSVSSSVTFSSTSSISITHTKQEVSYNYSGTVSSTSSSNVIIGSRKNANTTYPISATTNDVVSVRKNAGTSISTSSVSNDVATVRKNAVTSISVSSASSDVISVRKNAVSTVSISSLTSDSITYSKTEEGYNFSGQVLETVSSSVTIQNRKNSSSSFSSSGVTDVDLTYTMSTIIGTNVNVTGISNILSTATKAIAATINISGIGIVTISVPPKTFATVYRSNKTRVWRGLNQEEQFYLRNNMRGR
jgi:hypothetical protein